MNKKQIIPSVNFHLWEPCNMRCDFCFATFQDVKNNILPKGHLEKRETIEIIKQLAHAGFEKITFAGGEPVLCPWLTELIKTAKENGMITMIVTNGSRLDNKFLNENQNLLDWIAISIDSLNSNTNNKTGRTIKGRLPFNEDTYLKIIDNIKKYGYKLKINTTVNRFNYKEDMNEFMLKSSPERWKVFQVLNIKSQNDRSFYKYKISEEKFNYFIKRHLKISNIVPENNDLMKGSYVMIDPAGRFFTNTEGDYKYSRPILSTNIISALNEMNYDFSVFLKRKGIYAWNDPVLKNSTVTNF